MLSLHTRESVLSLRHAPSWLLLASAAGAVNAIGFVACARFVTQVTGTFSHIGIDASGVTTGVVALESVLIVGSLVLGAVTSSVLLNGRHQQGKRPLHALPLVSVAAILALLGVLGTAGVLGGFGGPIDGAGNVVFLAALAFAMGAQNAAVTASTGLVVRTTHMTGSATDLGVHLAAAFLARGDARRLSLRHAALRAGKITGFTGGAAAGAVLAVMFAFDALFFPAAAVLVATFLSFVRAPHPSTAIAPPALDPAAATSGTS